MQIKPTEFSKDLFLEKQITNELSIVKRVFRNKEDKNNSYISYELFKNKKDLISTISIYRQDKAFNLGNEDISFLKENLSGISDRDLLFISEELSYSDKSYKDCSFLYIKKSTGSTEDIKDLFKIIELEEKLESFRVDSDFLLDISLDKPGSLVLCSKGSISFKTNEYTHNEYTFSLKTFN